MIDHLLSTETMKINHHATTTSRIEKIKTISRWEPVHNFLRVCTDEEKRSSTQNCGRCEKCVRTMTMLEICGSLTAFKTFQRPFGKWDIMKWTPHYEEGEVWTPEAMSFAIANHHNEYLLPLRIAHLKGKLRKILRNFIPRPVFNWLKKKKYAYQQDLFNPDFIDRKWYPED
jgi:hypothetical protein